MFVNRLHFLCGSRALFTGPASTDSRKFFFKTGSHDIIHTFKNYFATVFSIFSNKRYPYKSEMKKEKGRDTFKKELHELLKIC